VYLLGVIVPGQESIVFPINAGIHSIVLPACKPGWRQKLHYLRFLLYTCWLAIRYDCRWIYASDLFSTPVALVLKILLHRRVVYHEHDSPGKETGSVFIRICMRCRAWLARRADLIVFPNEERGRQFAVDAGISNEKILTVWNCPAKSEAEGSHDDKKDEFWLIFHGSIVPDRLPLAMVQALTLLPDQVKLRVIGYETVGSVGYVAKMLSLARELGVYHRIQFLGSLPRSDVLSWCRQSDVGLSFMPMKNNDLNMLNMTGASNKPFDNLAAGIPLIVSDLKDWNEMFVDAGYALSCNPDIFSSIAEAALWFYDHPSETRSMGEEGRRKITSAWNYEQQFSRVLEQLTAGIDG